MKVKKIISKGLYIIVFLLLLYVFISFINVNSNNLKPKEENRKDNKYNAFKILINDKETQNILNNIYIYI